jgi:hypothetical protein
MREFAFFTCLWRAADLHVPRGREAAEVTAFGRALIGRSRLRVASQVPRLWRNEGFVRRARRAEPHKCKYSMI